jgi:uncharacterized protein (DUF433 family)
MATETLPLNSDRLVGDLIQPGHPLFGTVWINRERMSGQPCFYGTRVPIRHLFEYLEGGDPIEDFLTGFPGVTREQCVTVLQLASRGLLAPLAQP